MPYLRPNDFGFLYLNLAQCRKAGAEKFEMNGTAR